MSVIIKYIKLARITGWGPYLLLFSIGLAYASSFYSDLNPVKLLIAFASFFASLAFVFALNFYADIDVDKLHDGKAKDIDLRMQPILSGIVSKRETVCFCIVTFIVSSLGLLVNNLFGIFILLNSLIGILYSIPPFRLKARPIGDVACNVVSASILLFLAGMNLQEPHFVDGFLLLSNMVIFASGYLPTVVADYEFDRKAKLNTTVVYFGKERVYRFYKFSLIIILLCIFGVLVGNYDFTFKLYVILIHFNLYVILSLIIKGKFKEDFERIDVFRLSKQSFAASLLYLCIALLRYTLF